jgi:alcohol dehydrogenase YqhD (iron-dependent ADH family)
MKNLSLANPVRLIFGNGEIDLTGEEAKRYGKKAVIVTGKSSAKSTGTVEKVKKSLEKAGVGYVIYAYVTPNPKVCEVDEAAELAIEEGCDMVIGLGGGSAMDAAKGVAVAAANKKSIWDFVSIPGKNCDTIESILPLLLIPTLAASGSEGNCAAVFTNDETKQKTRLWNPILFPKVSIVDPGVTATVPAKPTAEGIIDIMMHVLEEYLTCDNDCSLQDRITE